MKSTLSPLQTKILRSKLRVIPLDIRRRLEKAVRYRRHILQARRNINLFIPYISGFKQKQLHRDWQDFADHHDRAFIEAPQEHGKTTQMAVFRPLFILGRNPNAWIKIISSNDTKGAEILSEIVANIESNEKLHEIFPNLKPAHKGSWTKHQIVVERTVRSKNPSIEAVGILSTGSGGRATHLIFDDPVDFRNSILLSSMRPQLIKAYKDVWLGCLMKDGRIIYICNAWHEEDLTQEIKKKKYNFVLLTTKIDEKFTSLWPEVWPTARLIRVFGERGSDTFNRAFRHVAFNSKTLRFAGKLVGSMMKKEEDIRSLEEFVEKHVSPEWPRFAGVDLAISKQKKAARTVIFEIAVDEDGNRWPTYMKRGRFTSPDTARAILELYQEQPFYLMKVENNNYQQALIQWIDELLEIEGKRKIMPPIEGYMTGLQKFDPELGLPSLALQLEKKKWRIPNLDHSPTCQCGTCIWIDDLKKYPEGNSTFDTIMAMWFADRAAQASGREPNVRVLGEDEEVDEPDENSEFSRVFERGLSQIYGDEDEKTSDKLEERAVYVFRKEHEGE